MTVSEYAKKEEELKNNCLGKCIDYDGSYPGECWDLAEVYFTQYLGLPASILAGCGYVNNMLYPPKINELLEYFDEVPMNQMIKGDVVIWSYGHIAVYNSCPDGYTCWFVTQNNPVPNITTLSPLSPAYGYAFRLKGIVPDPEPVPPIEYKIGDVVEINGVYVSSVSEEMLEPAVTTGTITYIVNGARNPYLLDNGDLGWVNNNCIIGIVEPEPTDEFKVGDYVVPTILEDYQGNPLTQYDDLYQIIGKDDRGNILGAVRGDDRPIWAILPDSNIKKA